MSTTGTEPPALDFQQQLAVERTDLAHLRTRLAEQRTYSAWVRTGLAAVAAGVGIAELTGRTTPTWLAGAIGILFILTGATMFALAYLGIHRATRRPPATAPGSLPRWVLGALSLLLLVGSAIALWLVVRG